ncbi:MAG: TolC family protein [Lentisphaeria bacterium]|nr:TolC family protein [Candidatus Neomarinimicrobiota bacterium]MCF7841446.1 TolC family protein [Lentisphaeria bacterium]
MQKILKYIIISTLIAWTWTLMAQPMVLSLDNCIDLAQEQGPEAKMARQTFNAASWNHKASEADYLPQLALTADLPGLVRAISSVDQDDGSVLFRAQSQTFSRLNLTLNQKIAITGGELYLSSGLNRITSPGLYWQSVPLIVGISQPLFQFNTQRWNRRIENMQFHLAELQYQEALADVNITAVQRFFDVYIAQMNVNLARLNLAVNDSIYTISKGRYSVGKIAENDLLQSELARMNAEANLSNSLLELDRALRNLRIILDLPLDKELVLEDPPAMAHRDLNIDRLTDLAKSNSSVLPGYELQLLQAERALQQAKSNRWLDANISASWGYNKSGETIDDVYNDPFDTQRFSVGLEVPLFNWGQGKAREYAALTSRERARTNLEMESRQFEEDVYYQVSQFRQLQQQLLLSAKSDTIGARQFEVTKNRYLIGRVDITNLLRAQQEKDAARKSYIQNLRSYWLAFYRLKRLTLADF